MTQFTFFVPQSEGYEAVYLRPGQDPGWVDVHKNSETGSVEYTFKGDNDEDGTGMYIVDADGLDDFLFVDQVSAARKPTATTKDPDDHGILVRASGINATGGTLRIEAGITDQYMTITQSSSTSNVVEVTDIIAERTGVSRAGAGVTNLTLRTSDLVPGNPPTPATAYYPTLATSGGGTDVIVRNLVQDIFLTVDTGSARYNRIWLGTNESLENGRIIEEANVITGAGRCIVTVRGDSGASNITPARIDFGPRSQTGHNRLEVLVNGVVTLAQLAGANHTIAVEEVVVDSGYSDKLAQLYVEDPSEIDDLDELQWAHAYVQSSADGTEVGSWLVNPSCAAFVQGESTIGDFTIEGEVEFHEPSNPSTVNQFRIGTTTVPTSSGEVNILNGADVTALTDSKIGTLNFPGVSNSGKLTLQPRPTPHTSNNARKLIVKSVSMSTSNTSKLDLKDNVMIVDYTGTSPLADVQSLITSAYNASAAPPFWTGSGITSSTAEGTSGKGLGYGEATDSS